MLILREEDMFEQEMSFFINNQEDLVNRYPSKVLVLIGESIVGVFDDYLIAYSEISKNHKPGTFLLQRAIPGKSAYTVTISSIAYV